MIPHIAYGVRPLHGSHRVLHSCITSAPRAWAPMVLAAAVGLTACGDGGSGEFLVRDSAGVRIATSRSPAWGAAEPRWRLTDPSVTVRGGDSASSPLRAGQAHRFSDGRILVLDTGSYQLRFYDPDGRPLRAAGGPGNGPGEYRSLDGVAVIDDSLWIWDRELGRVSVLDLEGRYLRSFRLEPTGDPLRPLRRYRLAGSIDGSRLVLVTDGGGDTARRAGNLLYSRRGFLVDSIALAGEQAAPTVAGFAARSRSTPRDRPIRPVAHALGDGQVYRSDPVSREVRVYDVQGGLRLIMRAEAPAATEPIRGARIVVSERGHVWARRRGGARGPADWLVFDDDGRWLGVVESPRGEGIATFEIHQVGPWGVLAVWRDRDEVGHVGVWAVES